MNLIGMLKGPVVVAIAVTVVSMFAGQYISPIFGSYVAGGTALVAVLVLDLLKIKY